MDSSNGLYLFSNGLFHETAEFVRTAALQCFLVIDLGMIHTENKNKEVENDEIVADIDED